MNNLRIKALVRFSLAITVLTIIGHLFLGFEVALITPVIALLTAYFIELLFSYLSFLNSKREKVFIKNIYDFLSIILPAHITALAIAMLLYSGEEFIPIIFATAVAILSKYLLRADVNGVSRHMFNPSNTGITLTLILFPRIGITPPYQFTENIIGIGNWIFPAGLIIVGSFLNLKYTKKMPLILAWLFGFLIQATIRSIYFDFPIESSIVPMSGIAFLLFTFYMASDPGTTPKNFKNQVMFGFALSVIYSLLIINHIVFGLFYSLTILCGIRFLFFYIKSKLIEYGILNVKLFSKNNNIPQLHLNGFKKNEY